MAAEQGTSEEERQLMEMFEHEEKATFGFVVFRTDFEDDDRWEKFLEEYQKILDAGMQQKPELKEAFELRIVEDDVVDGVGSIGVASAFQMLKAEGEIDSGFDTKMCLFADAECMSSVVDQSGLPILKAVDVNYGLAQKDREYQHVFKVSIAALPASFYPALQTATTASSLAPAAGSIWKGETTA